MTDKSVKSSDKPLKKSGYRVTVPGIVIAGTNSGCGKTTAAMGIMAALAARGLKVQPYKVGPDYIDPMFHTVLTGRDSINLDSWILSEDTVRYLFWKHGRDADIAVIEGVMGLYDGFGGTSVTGSTAHVAEITGVPVILVIDGSAMSLSSAALVKGFAKFNRNVNVAGVIANKVSGPGHFKLIKEAVESYNSIPVIGYLEPMDEVRIAGRHLGLVTAGEIKNIDEIAAILQKRTEKTVDIDMLLYISKKTGEINVNNSVSCRDYENVCGNMDDDAPKLRIAVARDKAFCFYYKDNLELLESLGAELVYFSPLNDKKLPDDIHGLIIGGGYPELWAEDLEKNYSLRADIKRHIENGLPAYAECGGLMYLSESITCKNGKSFGMCSLIPGKCFMTQSLKRFGYVYVKNLEDTVLGQKGSEIKAHEFHYSEIHTVDGISGCLEISKRDGGNGDIIKSRWNCGYKVKNLLAQYAHLHFWSNPRYAENFVKKCMEHYEAMK